MATTATTPALAHAIANAEAQAVMVEGSPRLAGMACAWQHAEGARVAWHDNAAAMDCAGMIVRRCWRLGWPRLACYLVRDDDGGTYHLQLESALEEVA